MAIDPDLAPILLAIRDRLGALEAAPGSTGWPEMQALADFELAFWAGIKAQPDGPAYIAYLKALKLHA